MGVRVVVLSGLCVCAVRMQARISNISEEIIGKTPNQLVQSLEPVLKNVAAAATLAAAVQVLSAVDAAAERDVLVAVLMVGTAVVMLLLMSLRR